MKKTNSLWTGLYIGLLFISSLTSASFSMVSPIITKYAYSFGVSLTLAGTISGLVSVTALIFRPVSSLLTDRCSKKVLLIISVAGNAIAMIGYALAPNLIVLIICRVLHGLLMALNSVVIVAFGTELVPDEKLGEGIGYLSLAQLLTASVGSYVGIELVNRVGFMGCFLGAAVILGIAAIALCFLRYNASTPIISNNSQSISIRDMIAKEAIPIAILGSVFAFGNGVAGNFLALLGDERGLSNVGIYFTINAVMLLFIRPFAGKLLDKKGLGFVIYPAYIFSAFALTLIGMAHSMWIIVVAAVLKAIGQSGGQPALQAAAIRRCGRARSGVAVGTYYIGVDIGNGLGPAVGGAIVDATSYGAMFFIVAGIMASAVVLYFFWSKSLKKVNSAM